MRLNPTLLPSRIDRRGLLRAAGSVVAAQLALPTFGQQGSTTTKIFVGFPPGGFMDTIARLLSTRLEAELKRTVIVENRPGAGARLVASLFKRLPADGTNLMLTTDAVMVHAPLVFRNLGYEPLQDFTPVSSVSSYIYALFTGPDPKVDSLQGLSEWLHKNPGKASFGHPAAGSAAHFFGLLLSEKVGVPMTPVAYQGGAPLLGAVGGGGQVTCGINGLAGDMLEFHRAGRIRVQAVTGPNRHPLLPDVPTFTELGYPTVPRGWAAMYLPQGAKPDVTAGINTALQNVLARQDVHDRIAEYCMQVQGGGPEAQSKLQREDAVTWKPIIEKSGFKLDA